MSWKLSCTVLRGAVGGNAARLLDKRTGKRKQAFHFGLADGSLFAFAGLWDRWRSPEGTVLESCTILTTAPNELLQDIHDRMPIILHRDHHDTWLTTPAAEVRRLSELLVPFNAELIACYEVSSTVNDPRNDTPACAEPVMLTYSLPLDL